MSMPYPVHVVVVSESIPFGGEIALLAGTVLDGNYRSVTASSSQNKYRDEFLEYCRQITSLLSLNGLIRGFKSPYSIDPENVHLWIALDDEGTKVAKGLYEKRGDFSNKGMFSFSKRIVRCDFPLTDISNTNNLDRLHELLIAYLGPWKEQIWKVMCDLS